MAKPKLTLEEFKQSISKMSGDMTSDQIQRSNEILKKIEESMGRENVVSAIQEKTLTDIKKSLGEGGNVEKSLQKIQKSQEQSSKVINESLTNIGRNYNPVSNIKDETPLSLKEKLKQGVAGVKKSAFAFGEKTYKIGSNILEAIGTPQVLLGKAGRSLMSSAKGTLESAKDILNTPMDYTVEGGRFAAAYSRQAQEKRELEGGSLLPKNLENRLDERVGLTSFNRLKEKEKELEATKKATKQQTDYGFSPLQKDVTRIEEIKKEIERVDVRNAPIERKYEQQPTKTLNQTDQFTPKTSIQSEQQKREDTAIAAAKALQQENPEADNIRSAQEIMADNSKEDLEISKQLLETTKQSLTQLEAIRSALTEQPSKQPKKEEAAVQPVQPPTEDGGSLLSSAADLLSNIPRRGGGVGSRTGTRPKPTTKPGLGARIAERAKNTGGKLLGGVRGITAGGLAGGLAAGAVTVGGGMLLNYGLTSGADALVEATGADTTITPEMEAQDQANWEKASWWEKAQSGVARGIEGVGSFLGADKTVAAAKAARIKSETEYLKTKEAPATPIETMSGEKVTTGAFGFPVQKSLMEGSNPSVKEVIKENEKIIDSQFKSQTNNIIQPAQATGKYSPDPQLDRDIRELHQRPIDEVIPVPAMRRPSELGKLSVEYNDKVRESAQSAPTPAPIIMNNSTNNNTTKMVPMKADPRPGSRGSALDNYVNRISTY